MGLGDPSCQIGKSVFPSAHSNRNAATALPAPDRASRLDVADLTHDEARRKNLPTAEHWPVMEPSEQAPVKVSYARGGGLDDEKARRDRYVKSRGDFRFQKILAAASPPVTYTDT
jgi:hypothetical protein